MYLYDDPPPECFNCLEKDNQLDDIKYWFTAILDQLFGLEDFNAQDLKWYINEITLSLGMKCPEKALSVVRENRTVEALDAWKRFNNQYLNNLAKTGT